eukprot:s7207_g1.t1
MLRALLEARADATKTIGEDGETALHFAVRFGRFDSDMADLQGRTPMSLAEKGLALHVEACAMQPCPRCEARIQVRGELRWRLGKSSAGSTATPSAPAPPEPASEDGLCRCEVSGSAWRRGTDVDEDDDTEASDVAENDYDEEGEEEMSEDDMHEPRIHTYVYGEEPANTVNHVAGFSAAFYLLFVSSAELFDYNRENYKFDQEQRLERDMQRVEMQIERFDLFREDIEDLVKLTVDKMDMYHIVGALFLSFTALVYCEGIISGFQPPFFLGQYFLTVAASFVYLLLAVWLSMCLGLL